MKGLLYKDYVLFKNTLRTLIGMGAFILIVICIGITEMNIAFGIASPEDAYSISYLNAVGYCCFFIMLTPLSSSLFTPDEKPTTVSFLFSTPQAAKGQIQSKYYFLLILNTVILLLCFLTDTIIMGRVGEYASSASLPCLMFFCMNLILLALRIPLHVRFGSAVSFPTDSRYHPDFLWNYIICFVWRPFLLYGRARPLSHAKRIFIQWKSDFCSFPGSLYFGSHVLPLLPDFSGTLQKGGRIL